MHPLVKKTILINGHNLNLEHSGPEDGPVVILLHHGLGSVKAWRGQVSPLVEAGFRVVSYDRWGYGGSDPRPGLDVPAFTTDLNDLETLMDELNIEQAALVGHSDGGTIALQFASRQPQRVKHLVTVAAHIYVEPEMEPGILDLREAFETDERFQTGMKHVHGKKYESVFYNWFKGWHRQESLSWDMRPLLRRIECPVLVVQGELDEYASLQHARDISKSIPGAELWILPGAKHMLPQENPVEFNSIVLGYLNMNTVTRSIEVA